MSWREMLLTSLLLIVLMIMSFGSGYRLGWRAAVDRVEEVLLETATPGR